MPETPMHEDHGPKSREDYVRRTREISAMQTEPKPQSMQRLANDDLRPSMGTLDRTHDVATRHYPSSDTQSSVVTITPTIAKASRCR